MFSNIHNNKVVGNDTVYRLLNGRMEEHTGVVLSATWTPTENPFSKNG